MKNTILHAVAPWLLALPSSLPTGGSLEQASQAFRAGEYAQVLELAAAADRKDAEWPRMQYLAGEAELVLGSPANAEKAFRGVLAERPKAKPAEVGLARALSAQGKNDEAEKLLVAVLAAEPKDVGALVAHGLLLSNTGRSPRAKEALEAARKLDPEGALTLRGYVEVFLRADETPAAAGAIEAFSQAKPKHPMGPFLLAWVMERDGEDEQAIAQYEQSLERDPNFIDAHKNLAILCHTLSKTYQIRERVELAYEHYERYFALGGRDPELKAMFDSLVSFKSQILGQ